ncbi:MAG: single-stranded-DNA-specific exonuclease RecJ [Treponema sp.]|nr:single-stranded-DNA-specific exonuclease RecJ [Treponema sp.]
MKKYIKKNVSIDVVKQLHEKFNLSKLEASILARRNITSSNSLLYYLEDDLRFSHIPFLLKNMEDAVERILAAKEEGEKVLIFGDRDVDGITSTAILYSYFKSQGMDISYRLPVGEDAYGLSIAAIDDFAKNYGSLIITVDCGISNIKEIDYANSLGIDVIVTDHHNPPEVLPNALTIIDPKISDSGYPFKDISGAAVAYKLVSALRFSKYDIYNQEFCLLNVAKTEFNTYKLQCIKIRNLVKIAEFTQDFTEYPVSINSTSLPEFLKGQIILAWNANSTKQYLQEIFGTRIDFNLIDLQSEISKEIPFVAGKTIDQLNKCSKISKYTDYETTDLEALHNLFITYIEKINSKKFPKDAVDSSNDLQLVTLAALADIMPMQNENRIFVKSGINSINNGKTRYGIAELLARLNLVGKPLNSTDVSWKLIPVLNAAGRLGQSNLALELLISEDATERERLAEKIIELNEQRKKFVEEAEFTTIQQAQESLQIYDNKICLVADEKINKGITGILATKMVQKFQVPSIAITFTEDKSVAAGSMRSCRNCVATKLLDNFGDFFINHGGHDYAAGFSFDSEKLEIFKAKLKELSKDIILSDEGDEIIVDAELPTEYINPDLLPLVEKFEPFGEENRDLVFVSKSLKIQDAKIMGKTEPYHLKITFDCGKYKFPAIFWKEGERLNRDFKIGDKVDVLYTIGKNIFNGSITPQMIIIDIEKSI